MDEWIKVILLGIVEGVSEFLPISSTGHLIITADALHLRGSLGGIFEIFIQIGAVAAVLAYYRADLWQQARSITTDSASRHFWLAIVIAFFPAALLGVLFIDTIETVLFSPLVVAFSLIIGGILFLVVEHFVLPNQGEIPPQSDEEETAITLKQALIIGLWQILALIPGMSRSGMSIIGGMLAGMRRTAATHFSFYLAIPTLGGATVYTLLKSFHKISPSDIELLLLGSAISAIISWLAIDWLLHYISKHNFIPFGYYRIVLGVIILMVALVNNISL